MDALDDLARRWQRRHVRTEDLSLYEQEQVHLRVMEWAVKKSRAHREALERAHLREASGGDLLPKTCIRCHNPTLTRGDFGQDRDNADGLDRWCRACRAITRAEGTAKRKARLALVGNSAILADLAS